MAELRYGDDRTIHANNKVNIEVDECGSPVAVWFRCMRIPFDVHPASADRAKEMREATKPPPLKAVIFEVPDPYG